MKGIYNCRPPPPKPRYAATWDVGVVTEHIQSLEPNANLSLKQLSQKLVLLMVLVEASCTSEHWTFASGYSNLKVSYLDYHPSPRKGKCERHQKRFSFGTYPPEEQLCVVETLRDYEGHTKQYRGSGETPRENKLLLSYVKPHKPVTSQCIAHRIRTCCKMQGWTQVSSRNTRPEVHQLRQHTLTVSYKQQIGLQIPRLNDSIIVYLKVLTMQ